jgi:hypothetical protein
VACRPLTVYFVSQHHLHNKPCRFLYLDCQISLVLERLEVSPSHCIARCPNPARFQTSISRFERSEFPNTRWNMQMNASPGRSISTGMVMFFCCAAVLLGTAYAQNETMLGPGGVDISSVPQIERQQWRMSQINVCTRLCGDSIVPSGQTPRARNTCNFVRTMPSRLQVAGTTESISYHELPPNTCAENS